MKYIVANWKMNKTTVEANDFFSELSKNYTPAKNTQVIICPPFTALSDAASTLTELGIGLGAQNIHTNSHGAFTGEISGGMLRDLGTRFVLIGHSERRAQANETDAIVNKKIAAAFESNITPIICIGETKIEREDGSFKSVLKSQIETSLDNIELGKESNKVTPLIFAYEPVWAIGTGLVATPDIIAGTHTYLKDIIVQTISSRGITAMHVPLLYGGSATDQNAQEILSVPNVDGLLIGGAALDAVKFSKIISVAQSI